MSGTLRARRPYTAPSEDDDGAPPVVLDPQEQAAVVEDLVGQAQRAGIVYKRAATAFLGAVLLPLLLLPKPSTVPAAVRYLTPACLATSFARLAISLSTTSAPGPLDLVLLVPAAAAAALLMLYITAGIDTKMLWGVAPVAAQLLGVVAQRDAHIGVKEAEQLRRLMYSAPEA
ncbi:hypothetical protein JCM10213_007740 [Rhodosporidiobolus nylandii]